MSDGHGCDVGGQHCGNTGISASGAAGDAGYDAGADGRTPVPNIKRMTINGAPVSEASHEYVIEKTASPRKF
ncbi:hypothetical protein [Sphingomonas soli]|uniref:hypothetical protein n=1 Tax=Sphingomonas soli TaxID=266127 RepID=UPI0008308959|nr:hypothetical protein [Sphingomonas soli]